MNINDLLIEYDEMGMSPTTVCENPEQFAIDWRERVRKEFERLQAENDKLRARLKNAVELPFFVIDKKTGEVADVCKIALKEKWAKHLLYCDIDSFAIKEDGTLILIDDCNNIAYCPYDRFEIKAEAKLKEIGGEQNE